MNQKEKAILRYKIKRILLAAVVFVLILTVLGYYRYLEKKTVVENAEQIANQTADHIADTIASEIGYASSSIKLSAVTISQAMTSDTLDNPAEIIWPMIENTPFGGIEYIRADGMNVMNIGEPFDASDRVYYQEGIKGESGIWNNFHPKTSKETLMNFYTPLIYEGEIAGVITGYIETKFQIASLFEKKLFGQDIYGLLVDENNMVICSSLEEEYVKDLTLERFIDYFDINEQRKKGLCDIIKQASGQTKAYKIPDGAGRVSIAQIPDTQWKVVIIIPGSSFKAFVSKNTRNSVISITVICIIILIYAAYILIDSVKRRKAIAIEKARLQVENLEIRDIIASAEMGTWHIEISEDHEPRMFADDTMKRLLGIDGIELTPEGVYKEWYSNITPEAIPSVIKSVDKMKNGNFDENTYLWKHPTKGVRYVRCGGTAKNIEGGVVLRGYHYDVDDVVREKQAELVMLENTLNEKNGYYSTLGYLAGIFYSMHVIDLVEGTVIDFNSSDLMKEIVTQGQSADEMMAQVIKVSTTDEYVDVALEFTNLNTIADRMKNKKIVSNQFIGKNLGWFIASFIAMENDEDGRPTKVIFTTRSIDEEKKQEQKLIQKSQTDELTGLLNRRAYEEDIYAHNDTPSEDEFIYISLDVNGLKVVNDTYGHTAGDELIIGSCQCMKQCIGPYGRLYRIGGDEFVAIVFANQEKIKEILEDFDNVIESWSGKLIDSLSISYGWISKEEEPALSVRQLGAIAEQRMYEAKAEHYKKVGVDRRGQKEAHKALCDLYTKILKINIDDDSYQIIDMDMKEMNEEMGFADSISKWFRAFGELGFVHPDDLDNYFKYTDLKYIREYFVGDKASLHIVYRRKYENGFKQVMMEIIPANDYADNSSSFFLYVKDIDN